MSTPESEFGISTERLNLRWVTRDDADMMLAVWNDPDFYKYVGDRGIRTIDEAYVALEEGAFRLYAKYGYGPYRVGLLENDEAIGTCGLFRREGYEDADIGWSILPRYAGRGYAYEAACAVLDYAFGDAGLSRVIAFISADNLPSLGLAKKLGMRYERMARLAGDDEDVCLYSMAHERDAI